MSFLHICDTTLNRVTLIRNKNNHGTPFSLSGPSHLNWTIFAHSSNHHPLLLSPFLYDNLQLGLGEKIPPTQDPIRDPIRSIPGIPEVLLALRMKKKIRQRNWANFTHTCREREQTLLNTLHTRNKKAAKKGCPSSLSNTCLAQPFAGSFAIK